MKKAIVEGMCCNGCAEEVKHIFQNIYGISNVSVDREEDAVTYEGFVSKRVIEEALHDTSYTLKSIQKIEK
ncbi:MAG: heavy-metal-associated domain-containing protein [Bacilli bacterium]|nr:heavy-metal-associated domain-containing protein [Bacilli bacterium]MBN2876939.1 heavy-metal-associated domain-containing protein [Bacilli bacterium]